MNETIKAKRCSKCKETKPISEFYKRSDSRDGYRNACKACDLKYSRTEKGKAIQKRYRQSGKGKAAYRKVQDRYRQSEKGKAIQKRYQKSEKFKTAQKRYEQSEKGKKARSKQIKRFKIRHPEQSKAHEAVKNAIKTGRLPRPDSLTCHYCPARAKQYHHYKGYEPEHWLDVVPVCIKCHGENRRNRP